MYTENQICEKIRSVYPDIGACGIDVNVEFSATDNAWVVHLKKDNLHLKTFLEPEDANLCMEGKQCIGLGMQIYQLRDNINNLNH
jgi:hypothetical protein